MTASIHARALDGAASETDAITLAREPTRAGTPMLTVTLERQLLLALLAIARRGVRSDADAAVIADAALVARTEGGR